MSITYFPKFKMLKFTFPFFALLIFINACSKKPEFTADCSGPAKSYERCKSCFSNIMCDQLGLPFNR